MKHILNKAPAIWVCITAILMISCSIQSSAQVMKEWERSVATYQATALQGKVKMHVDPCGEFVVVASSYYSNTQGYNAVVAKYDYGGNLLWKNEFNGSANGDDAFHDVAVDAGDNVYVGGFTTDAGGRTDMLIVKYNASGATQWQNTFDNRHSSEPNGTPSNWINAIAVDNNQSVFATGTSMCQWPNVTGMEAMTISFSSSTGSINWTKIYRDPFQLTQNPNYVIDKNEEGVDIIFSPIRGSVIVAVNADDTNLFVPTWGVHVMQRSLHIVFHNVSNGDDSSMGAFINDVGRLDDQVTEIAVSSTTGTIYGTGSITRFYNNPAFPNEVFDEQILTFKLNSNRTLAWEGIEECPVGGDHLRETGEGIFLDNNDNVFVCANSNGDVTTIKYNTNGNRNWMVSPPHRMGTISSSANDIVMDKQNGVYVAGDNLEWRIQKYKQGDGSLLWSHVSSSATNGNVAKVIGVDTRGNLYTAGFLEQTGSSGKFWELVIIKHAQSCYDNHTKFFNLSQNTASGMISGIHKGFNRIEAGTTANGAPAGGQVFNNLLGNVELKAGKQVLLLKNFRAGAPPDPAFHFLAKIDECQHTSCGDAGATPFEKPGKTTSVENITSNDITIKPYPNPFSNVLTIAISLPEASSLYIKLYDITGRVVHQIDNAKYNKGNHQFDINTSNLPPGFYTLTLQTEKGMYSHKVICNK